MTIDPSDPLSKGFTPEEIADAERYEAACDMRAYLQHAMARPGSVIEVRSHGPKSKRITIEDCAFLWSCGIRADQDVAPKKR